MSLDFFLLAILFLALAVVCFCLDTRKMNQLNLEALSAYVTNGMFFSYPGYNETLCGFPDPRIHSNDKVLKLCELLDPERQPGRLTLVSRMGAERITDRLPGLIEGLSAREALPFGGSS